MNVLSRALPALMSVVVFLAAGCDSSDGDPDVGTGADPEEDVAVSPVDTRETPSTAPAFDDDDGIRAWGEAALAACGTITSTVPPGWEMVLLGDTGCTVHRPSAWPFEVEGASVWIYASEEEEAEERAEATALSQRPPPLRGSSRGPAPSGRSGAGGRSPRGSPP